MNTAWSNKELAGGAGISAGVLFRYLSRMGGRGRGVLPVSCLEVANFTESADAWTQ